MGVATYLDPDLYTPLWSSIFTSIGSAANLGFIVFTAVIGVLIFKAVIDYFF